MTFTYSDRIDFKDNNVVDAYRKLRVSNQYGLFNSSLQNSIANEDWEHVIEGTGSVTYLPVQSAASLAIGTASGDRCMRQTLETFQYQAGTGTNVLMTGVLGLTQTGTSSRIGIFDDLNGIFFEVKDGDFGIVLRRTLSAGVTENIRVEQADFSGDKLDGTGESGYVIDVTKSQLFNIDYAWLGVGRVRVSVWTGDCFCIAHEFKYNNIIDTPFMGKGDLPLRYEIVNTAAVAATSSIKQICAAVFVEGGLNPRGFLRSALTPVGTTVDISGNEFNTLISLRIKSGFDRLTLQPQSLSLVADNTQVFHAALIQNATFSTPLTWQTLTDFTDFSTSKVNATNGEVLYSTSVAGRSSIDIDLSFIRDRISTKYDGTQETLTLAVRQITGGQKIAGSLNFIEFR